MWLKELLHVAVQPGNHQPDQEKDISKSPLMLHLSEYTTCLRQSSFSLTYHNSLVLPVLRLHIAKIIQYLSCVIIFFFSFLNL